MPRFRGTECIAAIYIYVCEDNNVKLLILRLQLSAFHRKGLVIFNMGPTSHGLFIIDSEISIVLMAMKRGNLEYEGYYSTVGVDGGPRKDENAQEYVGYYDEAKHEQTHDGELEELNRYGEE